MVTPAQEPIGLQTQTNPKPEEAAGTVLANKYGELEAGLGPVDAWDRYRAAMVLQVADAPVGVPGVLPDDMLGGSLTRWVARQSAETELARLGRAKKSPEELNAMYPGMPKAFSEPQYAETAQIQWDEHKRKQQFRNYIERGGGNGFFMELAAGLPAALDPINLTMGLATGGISRAMGFAPGIATSLVENTVGNLAADIPSAAALNSEHQDVNYVTTALGSLGSAVGATALHAGLGYIFRKTKAEIVKRMPKEEVTTAVSTAVAQTEMNARVNVRPQIELLQRRLWGATATGELPGPQQLLTGPGETRIQYGAHAPDGASLALLKDHGDGLYLSDTPHAPNNIAVDPSSPNAGTVVQYEVPKGLKLLETDRALAAPDMAEFKAKLEEKLGENGTRILGDTKSMTISDLVDEVTRLNESKLLPKNGTELVKEVAQETGYRGLVDRATHEGRVVSESTYLFDKNDAKPIEMRDADRAATPQVKPEDLKAQAEQSMGETQRRLYDQKAKEEIAKVESQKASLEAQQPELERTVDSMAERQIKALTSETPGAEPKAPSKIDVEAELKRINREGEIIKTEQTKALKAFTDCVTKGLI